MGSFPRPKGFSRRWWEEGVRKRSSKRHRSIHAIPVFRTSGVGGDLARRGIRF